MTIDAMEIQIKGESKFSGSTLNISLAKIFQQMQQFRFSTFETQNHLNVNRLFFYCVFFLSID